MFTPRRATRRVSPARSGTIVSVGERQLRGHANLRSRTSVTCSDVARQPVEVGAVEAREAFEPVERARLLERFGVQRAARPARE